MTDMPMAIEGYHKATGSPRYPHYAKRPHQHVLQPNCQRNCARQRCYRRTKPRSRHPSKLAGVIWRSSSTSWRPKGLHSRYHRGTGPARGGHQPSAGGNVICRASIVAGLDAKAERPRAKSSRVNSPQLALRQTDCPGSFRTVSEPLQERCACPWRRRK